MSELKLMNLMGCVPVDFAHLETSFLSSVRQEGDCRGNSNFQVFKNDL